MAMEEKKLKVDPPKAENKKNRRKAGSFTKPKMADCRITCIRKLDRFSSHEHITHVGNQAAGWIWSREDVIESIEAKTNTFYVYDDTKQKRSDVGVIYPNDGRKPYLRTYADNDWNDNLLSLPQC